MTTQELLSFAIEETIPILGTEYSMIDYTPDEAVSFVRKTENINYIITFGVSTSRVPEWGIYYLSPIYTGFHLTQVEFILLPIAHKYGYFNEVDGQTVRLVDSVFLDAEHTVHYMDFGVENWEDAEKRVRIHKSQLLNEVNQVVKNFNNLKEIYVDVFLTKKYLQIGLTNIEKFRRIIIQHLCSDFSYIEESEPWLQKWLELEENGYEFTIEQKNYISAYRELLTTLKTVTPLY